MSAASVQQPITVGTPKKRGPGTARRSNASVSTITSTDAYATLFSPSKTSGTSSVSSAEEYDDDDEGAKVALRGQDKSIAEVVDGIKKLIEEMVEVSDLGDVKGFEDVDEEVYEQIVEYLTESHLSRPVRIYDYSPSTQRLIVIMPGSPLHTAVGRAIMNGTASTLLTLDCESGQLSGHPTRCNEESFTSDPQLISGAKRKRRRGEDDGRGGGRKKTRAEARDGDREDVESDEDEKAEAKRSQEMIPDDGISIDGRPVFVVEVAVTQTMEQVMAKARRWFDQFAGILGVLVVFVPEVGKDAVTKKSTPLPYEWDGKDKTLEDVDGSAPGPFTVGGEAFTGRYPSVCLKLVRKAGAEDCTPDQDAKMAESLADGGLVWSEGGCRLYVETACMSPDWTKEKDEDDDAELPRGFQDELGSMRTAVAAAVRAWYSSLPSRKRFADQASQRLGKRPLLTFDWPQVLKKMAEGMRGNALVRWKRQIAKREVVRRRAAKAAAKAKVKQGDGVFEVDDDGRDVMEAAA